MLINNGRKHCVNQPKIVSDYDMEIHVLDAQESSWIELIFNNFEPKYTMTVWKTNLILKVN